MEHTHFSIIMGFIRHTQSYILWENFYTGRYVVQTSIDNNRMFSYNVADKNFIPGQIFFIIT